MIDLKEDDGFALGRLLVDTGVISEHQLRIALEKQENATLAERLGMVLVHIGFCTDKEIELALSAQERIRNSKDPSIKKACAAVDMAIHRKRSNEARLTAIQKGENFKRRSSGHGYQAITPEILAKPSTGR